MHEPFFTYAKKVYDGRDFGSGGKGIKFFSTTSLAVDLF